MANIYDMADEWTDGGVTYDAIKMNVTDTASDAGSLLMDLQVGGASQFSVDKSGGGLFSDTVEIRDGTNPQSLNVYNTYTDASNYERGFMRWDTNALEIGVESAGTGEDRVVKVLGGSNVQIIGGGGSSELLCQFNGGLSLTSHSSIALSCTASNIDLRRNLRPAFNNMTSGLETDPWERVFSGSLTLSAVPTADPLVAGQVWSNTGVLTLSSATVMTHAIDAIKNSKPHAHTFINTGPAQSLEEVRDFLNQFAQHIINHVE